MIASIAIVTVMMSIVIGGALLYYANLSANVSVDNILDINGEPAENYDIDLNLNGYPNDTISETVVLKSYRNMTVYFDIQNDNEIETTIYYNSNPITNINLVENINTTINIQYHILNNATSGSYWSNISINPSP